MDGGRQEALSKAGTQRPRRSQMSESRGVMASLCGARACFQQAYMIQMVLMITDM